MSTSVNGLAILGLLVSAAQSVFLPTPVNGYLGAGVGSATCQALGMNFTLQGEFAATGPLVLEAHQPFYANDVAGNLTIPQGLGFLANTFLVDHVNVRVFLDLNLVNLEPAVLNPIPNGIWVNNTKLSATSDTHIQFPKNGGVLGGFGPIYAGEANTVGLVYLGTIVAELYLYSAFNTLIAGPVNATCPAPQYNGLLATFNTVEATSEDPPTLSVANGFLVDYPPVAANDQFGCVDYQYDCSVGTQGTYAFDVATCTGAGLFYVEGGSYSAFNSTSRFTVPADLVSDLQSLYPDSVTLQSDFSSFFLEVTNASPGSINALPAKGFTTKVPISSAANPVFYVPDLSSPGLNIGPFTVANAPGQTTNLLVGNSSSHFQYLDGSGNVLGEDDVFCVTHVPNLEGVGVTIIPPGTTAGQVGF